LDISSVQQKLKNVECPNCDTKGKLQAVLICSRHEETCTTACQCGHCGKPFNVVVPEKAEEVVDSTLICSIASSECRFEPIKKTG